MRAWDLGEALLVRPDLASGELLEWASRIVNAESPDNQEEMRTLHALTQGLTEPLERSLHLAAACELARWQDNDSPDALNSLDLVGAVVSQADAYLRDPFVGRVLADGALALAESLSPALAAEMHALAWRMGLGAADLQADLLGFYFEHLVSTEREPHGVVLGAQLAPLRLELCRRLSALLIPPALPILRLAEANCYADLAVQSASERRRQLTFHYCSSIEHTIGEMPPQWKGAAEFGEDELAVLEALNLSWSASYVTEPLLVIADALLALSEPAAALRLLGTAVEIGAEGDAFQKDLRLITSLVNRCWDLTDD